MNESSRQLDGLLELIERHIDIDHCHTVDKRYGKSLYCMPVDRAPLVVQPEFGKIWRLPAPWNQFDRYSYRQAFDNPLAMLQNMLLDRVVPSLIVKDDGPLAIRNDHGTIQIASILGGKWHFHEDNYPWVSSLDSIGAIMDLIENNSAIDYTSGVLPQSTRTLEFYHEQLSKYPKCKQAIQISLPDLQGPIDTADILWGSEVLLALLTEPEMVSRLMGKIVETMLEVSNYYRQFVYDRLDPGATTQHGYQIPGRLLIRNDSAIMVSPQTYRDIILPHDARVLKEVGSGSIHFCGNGQHLIEPMLELPNLRGIDLGQPEMLDTKEVYGKCFQNKIALTHLRPPRQDLVSGQAVKDFPTAAAFVYNAENIEDAIEVINEYQYSAN